MPANHSYYTICLVLGSCAKKKSEKKASWPQATLIFYPAALLAASQLFSFLESAVKPLILIFKGSRDIISFPLTCTVTKYLGEPAIPANPQYFLWSEFSCDLLVETSWEKGGNKRSSLYGAKSWNRVLLCLEIYVPEVKEQLLLSAIFVIQVDRELINVPISCLKSWEVTQEDCLS